MLRPRTLCSLALVAVLAAGCRLGVSAEVDVERDGSGTAALVVRLDDALVEELDALDVDPTAELTAAAAAVPDWQLSRAVTDDDALVLTLHRETDTPQELTDAFRELTSGLLETDPALAVDVALDVGEDGAASLDGTVELRTPIGPGIVTEEVGSEEMAEQAAASVDATLVVSLPGPVVESNADVVEGSTLTWRVEPGEPRSVTARSAAPTTWPVETIVVVVAAVVLVVSAVVLAVLLRRRGRR